MSAVNIDLKNFHQEVMNSDKPVLLDFWAPWGGPCRMVAPIVEAIANDRDDIIVGKVNIDDEPRLAIQEMIEVIPTLVLYRDGEVLGSIVAPDSKAMIDRFIRESLGK